MRKCVCINDKRGKHSVNYIGYVSATKEKREIGKKVARREPITGFEILLSNPNNPRRFGRALRRLGYIYDKEKDLAKVG